MDEISISRFKATCLAALDRVHRTGRSLVVTRRGVPIAQVTRPEPSPPDDSAYGSMAAGVLEVQDIVEPLPESDWEALR